MDIPNAITPAHLLLWALLALLLTWMVTFAVLAIRKAPEVRTETMTSTTAMPPQAKISTTPDPVTSVIYQLAAVPNKVSAIQQTASQEEVVLEQSLR